jgi:CubicO group peptidase (beta-lactamase class C family)
MADSDGYLIGAYGLSLTARDMVKLGLLYLRHGRWDSEQIVSSDYVTDSTARHNDGGGPVGAAYGYLWWVKRTQTGLDVFFAAGAGSQLILVVPKLDLVLAVASNSSFRVATFVNDIVLPAASEVSAPQACVARLVRAKPLH